MPAGQVGQRLDRLPGRAGLGCEQRGTARSGRRRATVSASRRLTASATRCCCAPSWMSRSSRRRSASWVSISRSRDARSSAARARQLVVPGGELGPQPDQPQHEPGLRREPGEQPLLHRGQRRAGAAPAAGARRSTLPPWRTSRRADRSPVASASWRRRSGGGRIGRRRRRPGRREHQPALNRQPDLRPPGVGALGEQPWPSGRAAPRSGSAPVTVSENAAEDVVRRRLAAATTRRAAGARSRGLDRLERRGPRRGRHARTAEVGRVGLPTSDADPRRPRRRRRRPRTPPARRAPAATPAAPDGPPRRPSRAQPRLMRAVCACTSARREGFSRTRRVGLAAHPPAPAAAAGPGRCASCPIAPRSAPPCPGCSAVTAAAGRPHRSRT